MSLKVMYSTQYHNCLDITIPQPGRVKLSENTFQQCLKHDQPHAPLIIIGNTSHKALFEGVIEICIISIITVTNFYQFTICDYCMHTIQTLHVLLRTTVSFNSFLSLSLNLVLSTFSDCVGTHTHIEQCMYQQSYLSLAW